MPPRFGMTINKWTESFYKFAITFTLTSPTFIAKVVHHTCSIYFVYWCSRSAAPRATPIIARNAKAAFSFSSLSQTNTPFPLLVRVFSFLYTNKYKHLAVQVYLCSKKSARTYVCPDKQMEESEEAAPQPPELFPFDLEGQGAGARQKEKCRHLCLPRQANGGK